MSGIKLFTIGFTKKKAKDFFELLKGSKVKKILDVRLNNASQLAGFSKRDDLSYFAKELCGAQYHHLDFLAPTKELLDGYKKKKISWETYEHGFNKLIKERKIEEKMQPHFADGGCLLCSEDQPHFCHRRLVAEYLAQKWPNVQIIHLGHPTPNNPAKPKS